MTCSTCGRTLQRYELKLEQKFGECFRCIQSKHLYKSAAQKKLEYARERMQQMRQERRAAGVAVGRKRRKAAK